VGVIGPLGPALEKPLHLDRPGKTVLKNIGCIKNGFSAFPGSIVAVAEKRSVPAEVERSSWLNTQTFGSRARPTLENLRPWGSVEAAAQIEE